MRLVEKRIDSINREARDRDPGHVAECKLVISESCQCIRTNYILDDELTLVSSSHLLSEHAVLLPARADSDLVYRSRAGEMI